MREQSREAARSPTNKSDGEDDKNVMAVDGGSVRVCAFCPWLVENVSWNPGKSAGRRNRCQCCIDWLIAFMLCPAKP